ncbi:MAG: DMT family transporter [Candidatus Bathyarchaeota archaeon]|nr:MAG: DMT family transporter [Candidatus Bathyarchaeota archaeon]
MNKVTRYKKRFSELGLFYSAAIWGSTFFVVKDALNEINPLVLVGYRFLLAAIPLGGLCLITRKSLFENIRHGLLAGSVLWLLYVSQTMGLDITTASNSGFITGLFVVFVPLFSLLIFKRKPIATEIMATIVAILGLWMLTGGLTDVNAGDLITLIAAATYALHILILDKYVKAGDDPYLLSFQQFLVVGAASLLGGGILGHPYLVIESKIIGVIIFLALLPTLSAFVIQVVAQKITKPFRVSMILALEPVFAGLFAWTLGGEPIIFHRAIGGLLIFLGMLISGIRPRI